MESEFEMTDLGLMKFFLGIEVQQSESGILKIEMLNFKHRKKHCSTITRQ